MKKLLHIIVRLLPVLMLSMPCMAQKKITHVILIGVDGLGAYAFDKVQAPNLRAMMKQSSWSLKARTVSPSSSAPNWASMVMGAGPELHGYTTWGSQSPDLPARILDQYGMFPSVYSLLRQQKPASEIGVIYEWSGIGYLFPKAAVNKDQHCTSDSAVTENVVAYIKTKKPNFLFVHLHDVDSVGHAIGHATPAYYEAVERTDAYVGRILKSIEAAGMTETTAILFTADHGGIKKGHGAITMQEMQIPWILKGPGIRKGHEVDESIMTFDTAATICAMLGLKTPQVWIARCVPGIFEK